MPPVGTNDTEFSLVGKKVSLADGKLTSSTGELAGSVLDMATAVANAHRKLGLSLDEAIRMASQYPANYINQSNKRGHLSIGYKADFVVLANDLTVDSTWIAGRVVYKKEIR
jgi:N-acetylglucosamine-6-phosphate deacetylase